MYRAFVPAMLKKGGSIINIASVASSLRGLPNRYAYGATKAAVIGLTKAMAADFIRKGIRVNAICPGTIQSPSLDDRIATNAKKFSKSLKDVRKDFVDRQPIGRLGTPQEIAAGAVWLASDELELFHGADAADRWRHDDVMQANSARLARHAPKVIGPRPCLTVSHMMI